MIHVVILAGGSGRRFWPKSRSALPKQLLCLDKGRSSLQNLFSILKTKIPKKRIWVVANSAYKEPLRRQLPSLPRRNLLIEPLAKNTAAAIGLAAFRIRRVDAKAIVVVLSSDHLIGKRKLFFNNLKAACSVARERKALLTIGINPNRPAEEFGYLKLIRSSKFEVYNSCVYKVERFIEKPNLKKAKAYLKSKNYLWNAGMFVWEAEVILAAMKKHLPKLYRGLGKIEKTFGSSKYNKCLLCEYKKFKNISIDYGLMEKVGNIYAVEGKFSWQELGSWDNLTGNLTKQNKIISGLHQGLDTKGCLIFAEREHLIATLGVRDLIIVQTKDTTLICHKNQAQKVKKLTEILEKDKCFRRYL